MKKFVAVAAACTIALCLSTTTFARVMPHGMEVKARMMEKRDDHKAMMTKRKISKRTLRIDMKESFKKQGARREEMKLKYFKSSSSVSSSKSSSVSSAASSVSSSAASSTSSSVSSAQ